MSSEAIIEAGRSKRVFRRYLLGWLIAQSLVAAAAMQYVLNNSESGKVVLATPSTVQLEGIEVDRRVVAKVTLRNNSGDLFSFCGNNGRCSEGYCLFVLKPGSEETLKGGETAEMEIAFTPGVAGPFFEEIALYCRRQSSTETVRVRVSGFAVASSE